MTKITIEIDDITVTHEFPKDDQALEIVRNFYADQVSREVRENLRDRVTDQDIVEEVLLWFVDKLYMGARYHYIERARDEAIREAKEQYEFKRPTRTGGEGTREPEDLGGTTGGSGGTEPPRTRAGGRRTKAN